MALDWSIGSTIPQTQTSVAEGGPHPGELFGPYRVVRPLGKGSQARVFLAEERPGT